MAAHEYRAAARDLQPLRKELCDAVTELAAVWDRRDDPLRPERLEKALVACMDFLEAEQRIEPLRAWMLSEALRVVTAVRDSHAALEAAARSESSAGPPN